MKKILVISGSSSKESINKKFASYIASKVENSESNIIDLNDFEMPIFSVDKEKNDGIPDLANKFIDFINKSDAVVISLAEHNGSYSSAFKNLLDWSSRINKKLWNNKPMFLAATSPGGRGGSTVLNLAKNYFPFMGSNIVASFSLPKFYEVFSFEEGIKDEVLNKDFIQQLTLFSNSI